MDGIQVACPLVKTNQVKAPETFLQSQRRQSLQVYNGITELQIHLKLRLAISQVLYVFLQCILAEGKQFVVEGDYIDIVARGRVECKLFDLEGGLFELNIIVLLGFLVGFQKNDGLPTIQDNFVAQKVGNNAGELRYLEWRANQIHLEVLLG